MEVSHSGGRQHIAPENCNDITSCPKTGFVSAIGKADAEGGAAGWGITYGDLTPMVADDFLHEVETEPGTAILRSQPVKCVKHGFPVLFGNSVAFVGYVDHAVGPHFYGDRSAIAAMFDGVLHDVHQGALQRGVIGKGEDRLFVRLERKFVALRDCKRRHISDDRPAQTNKI